MSRLRDILQTSVSDGSVPGAVGLIARGGRVEAQAAGSAGTDGTSPMARDSIFRVASITKPIIASALTRNVHRVDHAAMALVLGRPQRC